MPDRPHPMRGPNRLKLGVFSANADGGLTLTRVPERWRAEWPDVVAVAQMADRAGLEFFLPIARWRGFGGVTNSREWSFETLTEAAALAGVTEQIALFATVHVPMVHPVFAAKALATIDHASGGRAGLNIVCGWNPEEFGCFGLEMIEDRYGQGLEWFEIMSRIYTEPAPFDFKGRYYDLRGVSGKPLPVQRPRPVTLNAGFSPPGRDFAARAADCLFTTFVEIGDSRATDRRYAGAGRGDRTRGRGLHHVPRGLPSDAGRGRGAITSTTRWRWRIRPAPTTTWATRRSSPGRTIRRRIGCTASGSWVGREPIR